MTFPLKPAQYAGLKTKLENQPHVLVSQTSADAGTITTPDVTLSFDYDGTAGLFVDVLAKHSWKAKLASSEQIQSHIQELLNAG